RTGLVDVEELHDDDPAERLDQRPAARELPRPGGPPVGRGGAPVKRKSDHSGNLQRQWNRTGLPGGTGMLAPLSVTPATGGARTLMTVSFPLDCPDRPVDLALSCLLTELRLLFPQFSGRVAGLAGRVAGHGRSGGAGRGCGGLGGAVGGPAGSDRG